MDYELQADAAGPTYFGLQATWGMTKHLGGRAATNELVRRCRIDATSHVLDVGCGVGVTPRYLAQTTGCRVTGVDLAAPMIDWARRRATRAGLSGQVGFGVADAQRLPFAAGSFDAVLCESVLAFLPDQARALAEFVRVTRPGGSIGITEGTWHRAPPPVLVDYMRRAMGALRFQQPDGWRALLAGAGLQNVALHTYQLTTRGQLASDVGRLDLADLRDSLRAWRAFLRELLRDPGLRRYVRDLLPASPQVWRMFDYFGYVIAVGHKAAS